MVSSNYRDFIGLNAGVVGIFVDFSIGLTLNRYAFMMRERDNSSNYLVSNQSHISCESGHLLRLFFWDWDM